MKNKEEIKEFLKKENIPFECENNIFKLKNLEIRYLSINDCLSLPKNYMSSLSYEYLKNGKRIIWIKDYELNNKRQWEVLKSYICSASGCVHRRIFARDTIFKKVSQEEEKKFCNTNCFYSYRQSTMCYGLYLKKDKYDLKAGELLMIMSFGFNFFGNKYGNPPVEVIRVGSYINTQIIGGSSKLLSNFLKDNEKIILKNGREIKVDRIVFYVDFDHNSGMSMKSLGYSFVKHDKNGFHNYIVNDIPELGYKKGQIVQRNPSKNTEIKREYFKGNIKPIQTSGTLVYELYRDEYFGAKLTNDEKIEKKFNVKIENNIAVCNTCGFKWEYITKRNYSCPNCFPSAHGSSRGECELYDMLSTTGLRIIHNDRTTLNGKELDIYFPDLRFAIEYDGKHWHTEEKDKEKEALCKEKGIELIRIDDDAFLKNKEYISEIIVKEYLNEKYNQNVSLHLEKVKEVIRESGTCRPIICTDTGEIFNNFQEACKKFETYNPSNIINVCNGNYDNFKGYHFKYYDTESSYEKTNIGFGYKCIHVKCLETNEVFGSKSYLRKIGATSVDDCLYGRQKSACGLHWEVTEDEVTSTENTEKLIQDYLNKGIMIQSTSKKIICINTGEIFATVTEAAKKFNIGKNSVSRCCKGEIEKTKSGLRFMFEDENERVEFKPKRKLKRVLCKDLNIEFSSCKEAIKYFGGTNPDIISRVINGQNGRKSYKGHTFEYLD